MKRFFKDQVGAVTIDWVVITAAVVGFAIAAYSLIFDEAFSIAMIVTDALIAEQQ
ncbi:hypothetical protein [Tropicibacter alexandrii]|uniref:hypothetical protein n=1 Tax=Tropicibacter alexandrii TaxID=2267683 RepID=UPI0013E8E3FF|nr:hypothetical protein [Tropicibacter alexandrii]